MQMPRNNQPNFHFSTMGCGVSNFSHISFPLGQRLLHPGLIVNQLSNNWALTCKCSVYRDEFEIRNLSKDWKKYIYRIINTWFNEKSVLWTLECAIWASLIYNLLFQRFYFYTLNYFLYVIYNTIKREGNAFWRI